MEGENEKKPNETGGTYMWMNILKHLFLKQHKRLIIEMEHITVDEFQNIYHKNITNALYDIRST